LRAWATGFAGAAADFAGAAAGFAAFTGSFALDADDLTGVFAATFAPWRTADAFDAARVAAGALVVRADVDLPARDVAARLGALDRADFALVFALVLGIGIVRSKKPVSLIECGGYARRKSPATCISQHSGIQAFRRPAAAAGRAAHRAFRG
jgi:hypothetical protein